MTKEARRLRQTILKTSYAGNDGNLQSAFSSVEILRVLYDAVMNATPQNVNDRNRDQFVLSKGQSTIALAALLAEKGYFPEAELESFCRYDSRISMQADRTKLPGIEVSAGSLGHGFPIAAGMAWAKKLKNLGGRVFVLAGDGEMNEGTMWEAALFASSENLHNLTLIVDDNNSLSEMLVIGDFKSKLEAFGWEATVVNGHDENALTLAMITDQRHPRAIIAKTRRGYGCHTLLTDNSWFHRAPTAQELPALLDEVEQFSAGDY